MDMGFAMLIIVALGFLAYLWPTELGPKADPSDTQFLPRPEWYYIPVFQYLKYWHGSTAVLGILVIPGILGLLLVGLPFFDRGLERRPWKRPLSVGLFTIILVGLGGLGLVSHREDMRNPGVAAQLKIQHEDTEQFTNAKFEPELSGGSLVAQNAALANPEATKGKAIFEREGCNACHGDNGFGTAAAPKLVGVGSRYDAAKLEALLRSPSEKMTSGGMPAVEIKEDEMKVLISYLQSLK
jgi:ubiquinol-cytochrome c reductase cytochrome b subunit